MRVWHDPGHGGEHIGCEANGIVEKDWVLDFALNLCGLTGFYEQEYGRLIDAWTSYPSRANKAKVWGADLVLLHHVNAIADRPDIDGLMAFAYPGDAFGNEVANTIARCAPQTLLQRDRLRSTNGRPGYITNSSDWTSRAHSCLSAYRNKGLTVVLVEWGFATSPTDSDLLKSAKTRPALYATCAAGIGRAYQLIGE